MVIDRSRHRSSSGPTKAFPVTRNIRQERSLVTPTDRERLFKQKPATVWLTGLSGSGKSTIARNLEKALVDTGHACYVLDGDNLRQRLNRDLGFTADERTENIRRVAEVAHLMNDAGLIVITSFISPYREDRRHAREIIGKERFIEVFVNAPIEICEKRDAKGLYKKARSGEIDHFTGITAPYQEPKQVDLLLPTHELTVDETVKRLVEDLSKRGILLASGEKESL